MRGGYSGEAGFEIECGSSVVGEVWDAILEVGSPHGIRPAGWTCLETLRIEAGLLFFPFEMPHPHTTPWEVGMGWVVAKHKPAFRGRAAVLAAEGRERSFLAGICVDHDAAMPAGAAILSGGRQVGVVTSAIFSRYLMQSIALAAIAPAACGIGTAIEVVTANGRFGGHVVRIPFYDPMRLRTRLY
jgi:aminomethyltransferase